MSTVAASKPLLLFFSSPTSGPSRRMDGLVSLLFVRERKRLRLRTVDVAQACGFTSPAYFSQSFRKRFGQTAGAVRRSAGEVPISATAG